MRLEANIWMWAIPALFVAVLWLWNPLSYFSDEIVAYRAICMNNMEANILPPTLAMRPETFKQDFEKYQEAIANCTIYAFGKSVYRLNKERAEVYYESLGGPRKLVNCVIFANADWSCSFPDGSGQIVFIDGLRAISEKEAKSSKFFYQRRWQWLIARILNSSIGNIKAPILIPEQREYH